jgi:GAF domain-containing protein
MPDLLPFFDAPEPDATVLLHPHESLRLAAVSIVSACGRIFDPTLDALAEQAAQECRMPVGAVTLVRERDQIVVGDSGTGGGSIEREESICSHTILGDAPLVVSDLSLDSRFAHYAVVKNEPHLRFYAGAPIFDPTGLTLGSLCVVDVKPHNLDAIRVRGLVRLAARASAVLAARRLAVELLESEASPFATDEALERLDRIFASFLR